jgi:hypothetical protein
MAFPQLEQLRVELSFHGSAPYAPAPQAHLLYPAARAFFEYPCPHSDCDGLFDLRGAVDSALANASTQRAQGVLQCPGSRGRDPGSKRSCLLQLCYQISATRQQQR